MIVFQPDCIVLILLPGAVTRLWQVSYECVMIGESVSYLFHLHKTNKKRENSEVRCMNIELYETYSSMV